MDWKSITFEGVLDFPNYRIYENGAVWSLPRTVKCGHHASKGKAIIGRWLKQPVIGYRFVTLNNSGGSTRWQVHLLVLYTFKGAKPFPKAVCRHLDGDNLNCHYSNLVWGTMKENMADKKAHGRQQCGENHPHSKYTEEQIRQVRKLNLAGLNRADISETTKVPIGIVGHIIRGNYWKHVIV